MDVQHEIAKAGGLLKGEYFFALKKEGRIATEYVNMDPVFTYPRVMPLLGSLLLARHRFKATAIAGPAVGGIPLIYAAASNSLLYGIRTVWADKQKDGSFAFERMGFAQAVEGSEVLVVEDVTTTGSSALAVGRLIEAAGGRVLGYEFVWNRGGVTEDIMGAPVHALVERKIESFDYSEHPEWGNWPLVADIGHPEHYPNYPGPRINLLKKSRK